MRRADGPALRCGEVGEHFAESTPRVSSGDDDQEMTEVEDRWDGSGEKGLCDQFQDRVIPSEEAALDRHKGWEGNDDRLSIALGMVQVSGMGKVRSLDGVREESFAEMQFEACVSRLNFRSMNDTPL